MRVAVVGANGSAGRRHCDAFEAEGCDVVPIDLGDCGYLDITDVDIIAIAAPDHRHYQWLLASQGKHIFCEKPLTHDITQLGEIERRRAIWRTFSCNLPLRHSRKLDGINLTGKVVWGQYVWGRPAKWGGWRGDIENYSIIAGGGIHLVDLLMQGRGEPEGIEAVWNGRAAFARMVFGDETMFDLWVDFESEGTHRATLVTEDLIIKFDEPNDFRAPIRDFLEDVKAGRPGNGLEAIAANRVCLQIEKAAK